MKTIAFIMSRYKENIDLKDMKEVIKSVANNTSTLCKLIVYDKYEKRNDTYKFVPNIGREFFAWFDYVLNTWDKPDDFYVFVHPCSSSERVDKFYKFAHLCNNIANSLKAGKEHSSPGESYTINVSPFYNRKYPHFGNEGSSTSNIEDVKNQEYIITKYENLGEWWRKKTSGLPLSSTASTHGFSMGSFKNIQSWGKEFWEDVFNDIVAGGSNGEIGHFLERSMSTIAKGRNKRKIFLDCGSNEGQGFSEFVDLKKIDSDTEVYCFEPNPYCEIDDFSLTKLATEKNVFPKIKFYRSAILHLDGVCRIVVRDNENEKKDLSTAVHGIGNMNTVKDLNSKGEKVLVPAVRLSTFIKKLDLRQEDELRIKLDIEGSEFLVLEEFLNNFKDWSILKEIWVEWHERKMYGFKPRSARNDLEKKLAEKGVKIFEWK